MSLGMNGVPNLFATREEAEGIIWQSPSVGKVVAVKVLLLK